MTFPPVEEETSAASRRQAWRCRRGMLELDLVFNTFVQQDLHSLSEAQMAALEALLDLPDNQLWQLVLDTAAEVDADTAAVLTKLRSTRNSAQQSD